MADESKYRQKSDEVEADMKPGRESQHQGAVPHRGPIRRVNPLGMRVVIQIRKETNTTDAGLYLPEGSKESTQDALLGEVLEVASAIDDETDEEANISGIPMGALVLIPKDAGISVPWDENLRVVETSDVLGIVYEVEVS